MSVRIRASRSVIVCGARSEPEDADCYLDDDVHYTLSVEMHVLKWIGIDENWADLWAFCEPKDWAMSPVSEAWEKGVSEQRVLHPMRDTTVRLI